MSVEMFHDADWYPYEKLHKNFRGSNINEGEAFLNIRVPQCPACNSVSPRSQAQDMLPYTESNLRVARTDIWARGQKIQMS